MDGQTIIALATPQGCGALALIRASGTNVRAQVARMAQLVGKKNLTDVVSHTVHLGYVVDDHKNHIDQVMFTVMDAPRTFTGESSIEISCHNNPFIIEAIIQQGLRVGMRLARPGEFSQRAFEHGKINLLQAEAINELINAQTQTALKMALAQVEGSLSSYVLGIEQALLQTLAYAEASFEFLEQEHDFAPVIIERLRAIITELDTLKKKYAHEHIIREGIKIALIGTVNAGKSSLFNALLGENRAIVSNIPGTTRDTISASRFSNGQFWTYIDTAGIRISENSIEQEGIKRSYQAAAQADMVILAIDGSTPLQPQLQDLLKDLVKKYESKLIVVLTKTDLDPQLNPQDIKKLLDLIHEPITVSSHTTHGLNQLKTKITAIAREIISKAQSPFLLSKRQMDLLDNLNMHLQKVMPLLEHKPVLYELVAHELKSALESLSDLSGKSISERTIQQVFETFCVGK
ncbi:MAG: tRNA modification GTPase MnmE [candidate division TM6 bacterium GW2011_GWE2_41_16]|nr:MAG: tRNA modification GTPase MnmE [candidate division TM6 bacterium GW2011_GWE2_41_16]